MNIMDVKYDIHKMEYESIFKEIQTLFVINRVNIDSSQFISKIMEFNSKYPDFTMTKVLKATQATITLEYKSKDGYTLEVFIPSIADTVITKEYDSESK